jgi:glutathione S-transferase
VLTLYIANKNYSSWSLRPWLLLKQLQIPFDERLVPFGSIADPGGFRAFSPTGRVPCLVHDDLIVWDSLAIVEYTAELNPRVWPQTPRARAWARSASAEMHSGFSYIRNICTMNCGLRVRLNEVPPALEREWSRIDELWRQGLSSFGGPFLGGPDFTAVDAFFAPLAFRAQSYSPKLSPEASAYVDRMLALPHMADWYSAALQEAWRDEEHEQEARAAGEWLVDLRANQPNAA